MPCATARGLSSHKRSRLHFVHGSREEAARIAEGARSHFETGRCSEVFIRAESFATVTNNPDVFN